MTNTGLQPNGEFITLKESGGQNQDWRRKAKTFHKERAL